MSEAATTTMKPEMLPVDVRAQMLSGERSMFFNLAKFEHAQRVAKIFADSDLVPAHFRGKMANCLIALNYAERMGLDPFMVLQNLYIVHGRPGLESKLVIALINQSGKYSTPLRFEFGGSGDDYGCHAFAKDAKSGEMVNGPRVTLRIVKAEGWDKKEGSKWKTIPDVMFQYRAASWFCNVNCPEVKLGMPTTDELHDVVEMEPTTNGSYDISEKTREKMEDLKQRLADEPQAPTIEADQPEPDSGKRSARKPKPEPEAQPLPPAPPADHEAAELEVVKRKLDEYGRNHLPYVLQAKRNTGIAHPSTLDGATRILDEVERLMTERPPK